MESVLLFLSLAILTSADDADIVSGHWPSVEALEVSVGFDARAERFEFTTPLYTGDGEPGYWLRCIGGRDRFLDELSKNTQINFVGPLSCRLNTEPEVSEVSLLAEDGSPVWHTRGQFHFSQLIGDCGAYPEYGRERHFRLRGFELTLRVSDPVVNGEQIDYFLLTISVRPDTSITSPQAEQPGYLDPHRTAIAPQPRSCSVVLKGNDRRMCRDPETLSWRPCEGE
jgi:hypothetical protein